MNTVLFFVFGLLATAASASPTQALPYQIEGTVNGTVGFEKRSTITPMAVCEDGEPCAKPQIYWSMVVYSEGIRYELSEVFALGSTKPPASVDLMGIQIRPGSKVSLEARVEIVTQDYAILSEIKKARLIEENYEDQPLECGCCSEE